MKIHLVRFLVLRTIQEHSWWRWLRRYASPSVVVLFASPQADFLSKIHGLKIHGGSAGYLCWLSLWVRPCVYACVGTCIRVRPCVRSWHDLFRRKSHTTHKNGLNSGLYGLIGIRLPKRIINPKKRPKIKPYGRVRFLSVVQRA